MHIRQLQEQRLALHFMYPRLCWGRQAGKKAIHSYPKNMIGTMRCSLLLLSTRDAS